jgi:hypothetical protein
MENEQRAMLLHTIRMLSGFHTEEGPEQYTNALFEAVLEGNTAKAIELAEEAAGWVRQWEGSK